MASRSGSIDMTVTDGKWTELGGAIAPVPCWTCRRRRLRCDSRMPSCAKCTKAGIQCLGYRPEKPLVWVGLGRRGHKKLSTVMTPASMAAAAAAAASSKRAESSASPEEHARESTQSPDRGSPSSSESASDHGDVEELDAENGFSAESLTRLQQSSTSPTDVLALRKQFAETALSTLNFALPQKTPLNSILVNRDPRSAFYIDYYLERCCAECILYYDDNTNPYKQFIQLSVDGNLMHHVVVALAAHHLAGSTTPPGLPNSTSKYFPDALVHKNKAMRHLRSALMSGDNSDAVVAACLLLIWIELLESGLSVWRYHLDGMIGLLSARKAIDEATNGGPAVAGQSGSLSSTKVSTPKKTAFWTFHDFFEESCSVLHTFGSTLSSNKRDLSQLFGLEELDKILDRAESRSWTGCPSVLLKILCRVNSLCSVATQGGAPQPEYAKDLLSQLETFSSAQWAANFRDPTQVPMRKHHASAYQGAIFIYARRALRWHLSGIEDEEERLGRTAHIVVAEHLAHIASDDVHFKGILWPAFVAGAEARTNADRGVIRRILWDMYGLLHVRSVRRAIELLERMWTARTPSGGAGGDGGSCVVSLDHEIGVSRDDIIILDDPGGCGVAGKSWLEEMYEGGEDLLLI
ncbi:hypothetical protein MCOR25_006639 [Pyricularia grisea]|nr:hypothetical protein MCOR25_006639 [Pyricularia grisea]